MKDFCRLAFRTRRIVAALLCAVVISHGELTASAATEIKEVVVDGFGATEKEAIVDGLAQAVHQVSGVSVTTEEILKSSTTISLEGDAGKVQETGSSTEQSDGKTELRGAGLIQGYSVNSCVPSDGAFKANLRVRLIRYLATGLNSAERRRLAVIPRVSLKAQYDVWGPVSGDELTDRYTTALEAALVQARRFAVLDRNENAALEEERARWKSDDAPLLEQAKLGQSLGVDYLLFTRVLDAKAGATKQFVAMTGQTLSHPYADMKVDLRLILAATGEVKYADQIALGLGDMGGAGDVASMLGQIASRASATLTERIFPMQVVGQTEGEVVLNQGGNSVKVGERFKVFKRGEAMVDPYTKEPLGFSETEVATLQISRVDARVSYGRIVDGKPSSVEVGMGVRRAGKATPPSAPAPPTARQGSGGVKLPFDR